MTSEIVVERVVERDVERVFHLQCSCGAALVTTEKTVTCSRCHKSLEVRRTRKRGLSPIAVEYHFACCFCGNAIVTTKKIATCGGCGKALQILRAEKLPRPRNSSPTIFHAKQVLDQWFLTMGVGVLLLSYLFDLTNC